MVVVRRLCISRLERMREGNLPLVAVHVFATEARRKAMVRATVAAAAALVVVETVPVSGVAAAMPQTPRTPYRGRDPPPRAWQNRGHRTAAPCRVKPVPWGHP